MKAICALCKTEKELRQSHIIPEFMYQNIYDQQPRRFYRLKITLDQVENSSKRIEQKGIREYLLCGDCEQLLSKYETYAAETIYGKNKSNKTYISKASETTDLNYFLYEYAGFAYKEFKIFLMSLLWRLGVSKTFDTPGLDAEFLEKLRVSILNENPLEPDDFGCMIQVIFYKKGDLARGFILDPFLSVNGSTKVLSILVDGMMYSFYLDSKVLPPEKKDHLLQKDGSVKIIGRVLFKDKGLFEVIEKAYRFFGKLVE